MKKLRSIIILFFLVGTATVQAQEIQTLFRSGKPLGWYIGASNKFTSIRGDYANLAEIYGGVFINRRFFLGVGGAGSTNNLRVPENYSADPDSKLTWQYAQFGLMTEYVLGSNKLVHFNVSLFTGGGMTVQYERHAENWEEDRDIENDENFFYVIEPGVQAEINLFRWMRLSPGVSYRKSFGSDGMGMSDSDVSDMSYNVTLKFGKF
jgi:hypothetical protein